MKKQMVVLVAMVGSVTLLAATSLTRAGGTKTVQVQQTAPEKVVTPLEAWQNDFDKALAEDVQYNAADVYTGDDNNEYEALVAVQKQRYQEISRETYELRFGPWQGTDGEFELLQQLESRVVVIKACTEAAIAACGEGQVGNVSVINNDCVYHCKATVTVTVHGILPVFSHARRVVDPKFLGVGRRFCR